MIKVDAAMGGIYDRIGERAESHGAEDSSGLRGAFLTALAKPDYELCGRLIRGIARSEIDELRQLAVSELGEPEIAN